MHFSCILCDACQGICVLALIVELLCYCRASFAYGPWNASFITYNGKIYGEGINFETFVVFFVVGFSLFCTKARLHSCVLSCADSR